jgi:hypothetical protein
MKRYVYIAILVIFTVAVAVYGDTMEDSIKTGEVQ